MSERAELSVLTAIFGSPEEGSIELFRRLSGAKNRCDQVFCVPWLDRQAQEKQRTKWTDIVNDPKRLSYQDLFFYLGFFEKKLSDLIPEIRILATDETRVKPFYQQMVDVDMAYWETIRVEREPKNPDEWRRALIGHLHMYLMRELNNLSGHTIRQMQEMPRIFFELPEGKEESSGLAD